MRRRRPDLTANRRHVDLGMLLRQADLRLRSGLDRDRVTAELLELNERCCMPPLDRAEVELIIEVAASARKRPA